MKIKNITEVWSFPGNEKNLECIMSDGSVWRCNLEGTKWEDWGETHHIKFPIEELEKYTELFNQAQKNALEK